MDGERPSSASGDDSPVGNQPELTLLKQQLVSDLIALSTLQKRTIEISAALRLIKANREGAKYWAEEENKDFQDARAKLLDAADIIHQLAVGTVVRLQAQKDLE